MDDLLWSMEVTQSCTFSEQHLPVNRCTTSGQRQRTSYGCKRMQSDISPIFMYHTLPLYSSYKAIVTNLVVSLIDVIGLLRYCKFVYNMHGNYMIIVSFQPQILWYCYHGQVPDTYKLYTGIVIQNDMESLMIEKSSCLIPQALEY